MHGYGSLSLFSIVWFFVWVLWMFLLFRIVGDVFRSPDLTGPGRAGWTLLLVVFPFVGVLLYLVVRGSDMHIRERQHQAANANVVRHYIEQSVAPTGTSSADEITKLATLRDKGLITDVEFSGEKARLLSLSAAW